MYLLYFGDIYTKSCLLCFFNNPYISPFSFTEFFIYLSLLFFICFAVLEESRSFAPPKKWLISMVTWGIKCARGRGAGARRLGAICSCIINPRRACAARVTVVVMSVCLSVCLSDSLSVRYTSGASFRPENAVTYSAGNEVKKFVGFSLKPLRCRDPALPPLYGHAQSAIFPCVFLVYIRA